MRVLVTGGAGFIGSAVVRHLVLEQDETYQVLTVDKLTNASTRTSLSKVEDTARALHLIALRGRVGETYNVGGHNSHDVGYVKRVCALMDTYCPQTMPHERLVYAPDLIGHGGRHAIDTTKIQIELGWRATDTFETGVVKTVQWYLENHWWWKPLRESYDQHTMGLVPMPKT